jgi:hypothetical protein
MSKVKEAAKSILNGLQFSRTEPVTESPGSYCRECGEPIKSEYYDVGGSVICPTCYATRDRPRRRLARASKAFLLGSLAAAVGAGVYRMIMVGTGWNFSLIAILVGYVVGGAVRSGSSARCGWFYQLLAVFLTYSALVGMFLPEVWQAFGAGAQESREAEKQVEQRASTQAKSDAGPAPRTEQTKKSSVAKIETRPKTTESGPGRNDASKIMPAAVDVPDGSQEIARAQHERGEHGLIYLVCMLIFALVAMVGLIYAIPVMVGLQSPISLLIFGIGLWQAWLMNRGSAPPVTGPYRIRV